ncbi:hypothetical protein M3P36_09620 [Altererythrobacter sp. KTW20L]|uniref:hypothetical protein n=1 Tax=Altererythrobacter sp. KTW20L TaxID=2942210 RepID=UPI0020C10876|nr:hypothetical protein [Altererythrobacter sp. KTW20L]MCL6251295.1 hypothetical protein [Altererythrobacter sp. KTW20L]
MTLIIQIALGIFLGYLLIEHRARLGNWAIFALKLVLGLVAITVLITAAVDLLDALGSAMPEVSSKLSRVGEKLSILVFALPLLAVILFGAYGLCLLIKRLIRRWFRLEPDIITLLWMSFLSALIIWPVDLYLQWNTPYGDISRSVDAWSRQNGYADLFGGLLSFSLALWPWLVIFIGGRFGVEFFEKKQVPPALRRDYEEVED